MARKWIYLYEEDQQANNAEVKPTQKAAARYAEYKRKASAKDGSGYATSEEIGKDRQKEQTYAINDGKEAAIGGKNVGYLTTKQIEKKREENKKEKEQQQQAKAQANQANPEAANKGQSLQASASLLDEENDDALPIDTKKDPEEVKDKLKGKQLTEKNKQPLQEFMSFYKNRSI